MRGSAIGAALRLLPAVAVVILSASPLPGCEIEVKTKGEQKEVYASDDVVILSVDVFLTHRDCPEGIKATKFNAVGMKVLGATKWKEVAPERFRRLVKVKVTSAEKGEGAFHARRTCDKEGGYGVLKIKVPISKMIAEPFDSSGSEEPDSSTGGTSS